MTDFSSLLHAAAATAVQVKVWVGAGRGEGDHADPSVSAGVLSGVETEDGARDYTWRYLGCHTVGTGEVVGRRDPAASLHTYIYYE